MNIDRDPREPSETSGLVPPPGALWHLCLHRPAEESSDADVDFFDLLNSHLAWVKEHHDAGHILFSGPSLDLTSGIFVFAHLTTSEVEEVNATEPLVQKGLRSVEIIPWNVHQIMSVGSFSITPPAH